MRRDSDFSPKRRRGVHIACQRIACPIKREATAKAVGLETVARLMDVGEWRKRQGHAESLRWLARINPLSVRGRRRERQDRETDDDRAKKTGLYAEYERRISVSFLCWKEHTGRAEV